MIELPLTLGVNDLSLEKALNIKFYFPRSAVNFSVNKSKIKISDGAFIGSDAVLVAPVSIGAKALVGAGSVVVKGTHIPAGMVAVGVPAKVVRKI